MRPIKKIFIIKLTISNTIINNTKSKYISKKVSNSLKNKNKPMNNLLINYNINKNRLSLKNKANEGNKTNTFYLKIKKEKNHTNNKANIKVNQRYIRKMCKSFIESKNLDKNYTFFNLKKPISIKEKNFKNSYSKSKEKKKLIKNISKKSKNYIKIKNSSNLSYKNNRSEIINKKRINLSTNINNKKKFKETKEYSIIYTSPSVKIKDSFKNTNKTRNNSCNNSISQIKELYLKRNFSFIIENQKFIFVNKIKGKNNSIYSKKFGQLMNIINSSINNDNNNNTKKISVNKIDNLSRKDIKKLKASNTKPKLNIININNLKENSCLNNYNYSVKTEYDKLIPRNIIKRMIYNKINDETTNKLFSPIKRQNISTKNYLNTWSSSMTNNNSKNKSNKNTDHSLHEEPIPKLYSRTKMLNKNKRSLTEYNNFNIILPENISNVKSPLNKKKRNNSKYESKVYIFSVNENDSIFKRNNNFLKTNKSNLGNSLYNKTLRSTNKIKNNKNFKTKYINKSNIDINNDNRFNSPSSDKKIKINQKTKLNNTLNLPYINKNKIQDLIKNFGFNSKYERRANELISQKYDFRRNNYNYSNDSSTKNKKKFFLIK